MMQQQMPPPPSLEREALASTPSFRRISGEEWPAFEEEPLEIPTVDAFNGLDGAVHPSEGDNDDDGEEEFEFAVLSRDSFEGLEPISADEIFSNGRILPVYPLFNRALVSEAQFQHQDREWHRVAAGSGEQKSEKPPRLPLRKLMMEDRDLPSTSSSESDELEGIPADSYCLWAPSSVPPSPDLRRRSQSTGDSSSKRWRLRDLVIGRSHSDGRKKFLFLAPAHASPAEAAEKTRRRPSADGPPASPPAAEEETKKGKGKGGVRVLEMDMVTAHRLYYAKGGAAAGDRRRSYLPYRKELVGLFGNVNGAGRSSQHPF